MSTYYLSQHIFLCPSDEQLILLDIKNDRYFALNARQTDLLKHFLQDWKDPANPKRDNSVRAPEEASTLARMLCEKGLLTADEENGKSASPLIINAAVNGIFSSPLLRPIKIKLRHIVALCLALLLSKAALRWGAMEKIVSRVKQRRTVRQGPCELKRTRELVWIFYRLRPFFFRAENACLLDSLTLINFLAWFDVFPQWIFGVRNDPFAAHCWVQQDDTLLNDCIEHVIRYKPIMIV